jgi:crotonobetainyl-CoA:carnitine CoA-transferase CaiB-like acyl-CoA transferase
MRFPTPMADLTCGLFTLIGILAALNVRHQTGEGQCIDQSLQEGQLTWLDNYAGEYFGTGTPPQRMGNRHPQIAPYEAVQGSDGEWFILGVGSDNVWRSFCELVGQSELATDERFATNVDRIYNYANLMPIVRDIIKQRPVEEWLNVLRQGGVPAGRINSIDEALDDAHLRERGMIVQLEHPLLGMVRSIATPVHMSETPLQYFRHPPQLGEHTDEVISELGFDTTQLMQLRSGEVIA